MVAEFEKLLTWDGAGRFTKMAIPLSFGHLVRITCRRAGDDPETVKSCFSSWASTYVKKAWDKYKATDDHQEKGFILSVMANMRFGGHSRLLMPLIKGEMEQCNQLRTMAAWAGGEIYMLDKYTGWRATCSEGFVTCFLRVPQAAGLHCSCHVVKQSRGTFRKHTVLHKAKAWT